jgi:hypothetical protein
MEQLHWLKRILWKWTWWWPVLVETYSSTWQWCVKVTKNNIMELAHFDNSSGCCNIDSLRQFLQHPADITAHSGLCVYSPCSSCYNRWTFQRFAFVEHGKTNEFSCIHVGKTCNQQYQPKCLSAKSGSPARLPALLLHHRTVFRIPKRHEAWRGHFYVEVTSSIKYSEVCSALQFVVSLRWNTKNK